MQNAPLAVFREKIVLQQDMEYAIPHLDALDEAIINLIRERVALAKHVQTARARLGQPRVDLAREAEVRDRYLDALGWHGADISGALCALQAL